jgi:hypothetical protein
VDAAVSEARKALCVKPEDVEWGTPVLYMRSPDGTLFKEIKNRHIPWLKVLGAIAAIVIIILAGIKLLEIIFPPDKPEPTIPEEQVDGAATPAPTSAPEKEKPAVGAATDKTAPPMPPRIDRACVARGIAELKDLQAFTHEGQVRCEGGAISGRGEKKKAFVRYNAPPATKLLVPFIL